MPADHHLRSVEPPWVELLVLNEGERYDPVVHLPDGFLVRVVHGRKCKTKKGLLSEFARVLDFPSYYGKNWDALDECLTDLEWLPAQGYLLVITDAEQVLRHHHEDYRDLIRILQWAGKEWATPQTDGRSRPAIPFHVLFTVPDAQKAKGKNWDLPRVQR
ncbi:MAG: barstar family protein [Nitrospiraceae bacterium]